MKELCHRLGKENPECPQKRTQLEKQPMTEAMERLTRRECLTAIAATAGAALSSGISLGESERDVLVVAISVETLAGANVSDARAAYRIWLRELTPAHGPKAADPVPDIFIPSEELVRYVRQRLIDCYGVTALELARLVDLTDPDSLVLQDYLADGLEYVLLVHNRTKIKALSDLHGANIVSHLHRDMVLLDPWLSTMLADNRLPEPESFFASHKTSDSLMQVVLPVFFSRLEGACLARKNWETAVELNPQLGRDLRPLLISPKVIPIAFAFRRNTNPSLRNLLIDSIQHVSANTAGQQIVALYQSRDFVVRNVSVMKGTLEMVHRYERLRAQRAHLGKART